MNAYSSQKTLGRSRFKMLSKSRTIEAKQHLSEWKQLQKRDIPGHILRPAHDFGKPAVKTAAKQCDSVNGAQEVYIAVSKGREGLLVGTDLVR